MKFKYDNNRQLILSKWNSVVYMNDFVSYFDFQWLTGKFNKWQIFWTPPGFADTDNPLESFNDRLKEDFTKREQLSIKSFCDMCLEDLTPYYCCNNREFCYY